MSEANNSDRLAALEVKQGECQGHIMAMLAKLDDTVNKRFDRLETAINGNQNGTPGLKTQAYLNRAAIANLEKEVSGIKQVGGWLLAKLLTAGALGGGLVATILKGVTSV